MADDESRGVHLSDKQLVFVFMAATVTAVVVFLFGVLVGRGVRGTRGPVGDAEMTAAEGQVVPDGAPDESPAAEGAARQGSGGAGPDELSYPERLGKTPPAERLKPVPPPLEETPRAMAPPEVPEEPVGRTPPAAADAQASVAAPPAGNYTVQVAAVSGRDEADGIVKRSDRRSDTTPTSSRPSPGTGPPCSASGSGRSRTNGKPICSRSACCAKTSDTSPGLPASHPLRRPSDAQLPAIRPSGRRVGARLSPLLVALVRAPGVRPRRAFALGLVSGAIYFGGTLYWTPDVLRTFGGISLPLAVAAGGLLVAYLALFPAFAAVVVARVCGHLGPAGVLVAPAAWVAAEVARRWILGGFPWVLLGSSQAGVTPIVQTASLAGVYGLSALVAFVSSALALAVAGRGRARWMAPAAAACLVGGLAAWGAWRVHDGALVQGGQPVRVALVQGNVLQDEKWDKERASGILNRYLTMTREGAASGASLVVWPESSTPFMFEHDPVGRMALINLVRELKVALLFGSDQYEPGKPPRFYNSAFLLGPDGQTAGVYRKMHLVPFGEYVPLKRLLFFVTPLVESVSDFSAGEEPVVMPLGENRLSTAICYEVVYPDLRRVVCQARQPVADDHHQRRVVRPLLGAASALLAGDPAGRRARPLPRASRQHGHQRDCRPVRARRGEVRHLRAGRGERRSPLSRRPHRVCPHGRCLRLWLWPGDAAGMVGHPLQGDTACPVAVA